MTPQQRAQEIIREFVEFTDKYSSQIPLAIPKGTLKTIDFYRDAYFRYLKDSEFKSNICYMLQLIEYELWLYKLFKPQYSLESALFFQQFVTQGVVIEAIVFALQVDALIVSDPSDRSKGGTKDEHQSLLQMIRRRTFAQHVNQLRDTQILPEVLCDALDKFRGDIRNLVHLQNWEGRLYRQISQKDFDVKLQEFDTLLKNINTGLKNPPTLAALLTYYQLDGRRLSGKVKYCNRKSGRGQIECKSPHDYIPFFASSEFLPVKGEAVTFELALAEQGVKAVKLARA